MSSLLKKFTADATDTRLPRREEDLSGYQRPRDFVPQPPSLSRQGENSKTNLCSDVEIKGVITFKEYLRLDGNFEGEIHSSGTFIVGENGVVKADIQVGNLIVEGKIIGNVVVQDKIELRSSAQLFGDIKASRLIINEGVVFVGKSDVNPAGKIEKLASASSSLLEQETETPEQSAGVRENLY